MLGLPYGLCGPSTEPPPGAAARRGSNDIVLAAAVGRHGAGRHLLRTVPGAVASRDGCGGTALHFAAHAGHVEICRVLLAAKAEVDASIDGRNDKGLETVHWGIFQGAKKIKRNM